MKNTQKKTEKSKHIRLMKTKQNESEEKPKLMKMKRMMIRRRHIMKQTNTRKQQNHENQKKAHNTY